MTTPTTPTQQLTITQIAQKARLASHLLQSSTQSQKSASLKAIHSTLQKNRDLILQANQKELDAARKEVAAGRMSEQLLKRLDLGAGGGKFEALLQGVLDVDKLEDPTGKVTLASHLDDGLDLYRVSCPIGVLLIIFEARPEVVVQISCLAIKSGNAVILKGGKEASHSNRILNKVLKDALRALKDGEGVHEDAVQLVETRDDIDALLGLDRYIDLVIPRGSNALVKHIQGSTRIPVLGHADGICSVYLDKSALPTTAAPVVVDSKTSYPAACNSAETLLVHSSHLSNPSPTSTFPAVAKALLDSGVHLLVDPPTLTYLKSHPSLFQTYLTSQAIRPSVPEDYSTEFLDLRIAIKSVDSLEDAVAHINSHGSHHTDAIVTEDKQQAEKFMETVDAAGVYWNASTRFADGFRYGFGAEIGVSTNKTHSRGPVGLEGLVIYKYRLYGKGHTTTAYGSGAGKRQYLHEEIEVDEALAKRFRK
ncbi:hypothetical protein HDV05_000216 [Chytridiales sp. JEL 0842]|nr:hypothetical protein HDV05_000216 [Chytridiales sp. JEL 0842]